MKNKKYCCIFFPAIFLLASTVNAALKGNLIVESELESTSGEDVTFDINAVDYQVETSYSATNTNYFDNLLENNTGLKGYLHGNINTTNRFFNWPLLHDLDYNLTDSTAANTSDNREERSSLRTGPKFIVASAQEILLTCACSISNQNLI